MKRSEAIDNIACVLVVNAKNPVTIDMKEIARIATEILDDIEERTGMLPPEINIRDYGNGGRSVSIWEHEDETK